MTSLSENEQLERVFLRLGMAETDEQLESTIIKYLPVVLLKLGSTDANIRTKVLELLTHLNKRLKSRETVQLPVEQLLHQFNNPALSSFVTNFTIIYIKTGFPRLPVAQQIELAPLVFQSLKDKSRPQQDILLKLLTESLVHLKYDDFNEVWRKKFDFPASPNLTTVMLDFLLDVMLMPYSVSLPNFVSQSGRPATAPATPAADLPPGLSLAAVKRLVGDSPWSLDQIEKIKISVLNLIRSGSVVVDRVIPHLVVACSDSRHTVATGADLELRKHVSTIDWNSPTLVTQLYKLSLGHTASKKNTPAEKRQPANVRMKLKLMLYMLRSKAAAESFPLSVQLVYNNLFASPNSKLHALTLQFVQHIFDRADLKKLQNQAVLLLEAMVKVTGNPDSDPKSKCLAYVAIGKLSTRMPGLFAQRLNILIAMFQTLPQEESADVKLSMQEALSMMSSAYRDLPDDKLADVNSLIEKVIDDADPYLRQVGVQYAGTVFPPGHVQSRYHLLLASGDVREDVASSARKFLTGKKITDAFDSSEAARKPVLPRFDEMLTHVCNKARDRSTSTKRYVIGTRSSPFAPATFRGVLVFLRRCLATESGAEAGQEIGGRDPSDPDDLERSSVVIAGLFRRKVKSKDPDFLRLISLYVDLLFQYLHLVSEPTVVYYLLEMIASCPDDVDLRLLLCSDGGGADANIPLRIQWVKGLATHTQENIRIFASELYAIIFRRIPSSAQQYKQLITELAKSSKGTKYEERHGSLLLLGHVIADALKLPTSEKCLEVCKQAVVSVVECIENSKDPTLSGAACAALGQIGRYVALPLEPGSDEDEKGITGSKLWVVNSLTGLLVAKTPHKLREQVVLALGRFPVGDGEFPHTEKILQSLLETAEIKDAELHFSVGGAMCSAALGPDSPERLCRWRRHDLNPFHQLIEPPRQRHRADINTDHVTWLLSKILSEFVGHRVPAARQASCIWLMTMLKTDEYASHPAVCQHLMELQSAFTALLSESDELTQDIASKGFGIVYELGSADQKKQLVNQLVESLAGGSESNSPASKVRIVGQEGSGLFQSSVQLGKAPDGSSLTTYKELCSLASDLNQPDLVYKFLHLANHHALWNTKKGVAFGFRSIAEAAREQLEPHLPRIVPRLYRYTFDPQPSVRAAMTSIWKVIAPVPIKTVETYTSEILADLTFNLTNKLWRTRQASCLALADLLRSGFRRPDRAAPGKSPDGAGAPPTGPAVAEKLPELWSIMFRVCDDVKESVRDAAQESCKVLKKITIRLFDKESGIQTDEGTVAKILDVLLREGMSSPMEEVRSLSLSTLIEVSKVSGDSIKPCIPKMVVALLEALSGLEAPMLNYLHNRSAHVTQDALDWLRAEAVKSSPLMETAVRCLARCDDSVLKELTPMLADLTKRGVGLSTKAGCAHLITSLVTSCGNDVTPYAGKFMNALISGVADRSLAVRKVNSTAIGHLSRVAKDVTLEKTLTKMKLWYLEKEEDNYRHAAASVVYAVARHSPDALNRHAALVLPLAFFGMHEKQSLVGGKKPATKNADSLTEGDDVNFALTSREMWQAIWNEFTPGFETAVRIHLQEIIEITQLALRSSSWQCKAQAAASMSSVAKRQRPGTIVRPHLDNLLQALHGGLQGRTWDGKEHLLEALCDVCVHCGDQMTPEEVDKSVSLLLKECKREKLSYSIEAMVKLAAVLEARKLDRFEDYWKLVRPHLAKKTEDSCSSEDDDEPGSSKKDKSAAILKRQEKLLKHLLQAWPCELGTQLLCFDDVARILGDFARLSTFGVQLGALRCVTGLLKSLSQHDTRKFVEANPNLTALPSLAEAIATCLTNMKFSGIREESLSACEVLVQLTEDGKVTPAGLPLDTVTSSVRESPLFKEKTDHGTRCRELLARLQSL